jgi:hypothetical protein
VGLTERQLEIVCRAAPLVDGGDVERYIELKRLKQSPSASDRTLFEEQFASCCVPESSMPSDAFRRRYFDLLRTLSAPVDGNTYATLLAELNAIANRQARHPLPASLVSKLVAIHDESNPVFERYVSRFFGVVVPAEGGLHYRIALLLDHLERIGRTYVTWATDPAFCTATAALCERIPGLALCHPVRLCDFVVSAAVRHWGQMTTA